ncbi:MAG: SDR family NAD(P)-dependent oxidoreductase [Rhizobiaceae bacterium]
MSTTVAKFGRLDVLVNNAGVVETGTVESGSLEAYSNMMTVNAIVPLALIRAALPHLKAGSAIVNLSSVNSQIAPIAAGAFGASKAALEALTVAAAKELGPKGIRVNAIAPGITRVDDVDRSAETLDKHTGLTPLGRIGETEEVVKAVRFLATQQSSYITAECIRVAGGFGR